MHITKNHRNKVFKIYVQFDDNPASLMKINTNIFPSNIAGFEQMKMSQK